MVRGSTTAGSQVVSPTSLRLSPGRPVVGLWVARLAAVAALIAATLFTFLGAFFLTTPLRGGPSSASSSS